MIKQLTITTILLASLVIGCQEIKQIGCPESADRAVLNAMYNDFSDTPNYLNVWMSEDYEQSHWNPILSDWQSKIDRTRKWSSTLPDRCTKNSYTTWLDYYQDRLNSARSELVTQSQKKRMDEYDKRIDHNQKEAADYQRDHKVPSPPRD